MRLVGVGVLLRHQLRRDRVFLAVWVYGLVGIVAASAFSVPKVFPDEASRVSAARALDASGAIVALYGPVLDVHSSGELAMSKVTVVYALFLAVMAVFLVRRHTRVAEERGRQELVGSAAVGRDAVLGAVAAEAVLVGVLIGALAALVDVVAGLPVRGSLLFGASWTGTALVGAGLGLLACQLSPSARTCAGLASAVLGLFFGLRAVGDSTSAGWLGWLSPLGWNTRLRAWEEPRWWVLSLYVVLAAALGALAVVLHDRRDLGAGLLPERPGPATGSTRTALGLALRTQRSLLGWWTVAVAALGAVFGAIAPHLGGLVGSGRARDVIASLGGGGGLADEILAALFSFGAVAVSCYAVAVLGHGSTDESTSRADQVLATGASRTGTFVASLVLTIGGVTWLLAVMGVGAAVGLGLSGAGWPVVRLVGAGLGQAPAVWLVAALATLAYAVRSSWSGFGWALVGGFLVLGQVGALLQLPAWVGRVSPYEHAPHLPGGEVSWVALAVMAVLAAAVLVVGWRRFATRDIG